MEKFRRGYHTPPVMKQLKKLLDQYSDDGQILKELIQNAEDAGATEIKFLLDHTSYGTDSLINADLAQFQGPALYVYNNAEFTDIDWESIAMLLYSKKEDDPLKIGRFGMGFKAVYHLTDLPSLMSGDGIGFMDPHERYFEHKESCSLWKFSENSEAMKEFKDQFQPFCEHKALFEVPDNIFRKGRYKGKTLFRFPLRVASAKHQSLLSSNIYTLKKVHELFQDLEKDGGRMLLFLMHLQRIEVYEKLKDHSTKLLISMQIDKSCVGIVSEQRSFFKQHVLSANGNLEKPLFVSFPIKINKTIVLGGEQSKCSSSCTFIVTHYHGDNALMNGQVLEVKESLKVLPWVGAAVQLCPKFILSCSGKGQGKGGGEGQVYSFLPLPYKAQSPTGLTAHVHGYFVLDENRRHLKWPDAGRSIDNLSDRHHVWNIFVMRELLPQAMIQMALFVSQLQRKANVLECLQISGKVAGTVSQFQMQTLNAIMPDITRINSDWMPLVERFYKGIIKEPVFFTKAEKGRWLQITDSSMIVDNSDEETPLAELLRKVLVAADLHLVSLPNSVINGIEKFCDWSLRKIGPTDICQCLKVMPFHLNDTEKMLLLEYLLEGLNNIRLLIGLPLLPLDNGEWMNFEASSPVQGKSDYIYIETPDNPQHLLPGLDNIFIRNCMKQNEVLKTIAKAGTMQLKLLDKQSMLQLICLIPGLRDGNGQSRDVIISNENRKCLTEKWFERMWKYIDCYCITDLLSLADLRLYLLPSCQTTKLAMLGRNLPLIFWDGKQSQQLKEAMKCLGAFLLDSIPRYVASVENVLGTYILKSNLNGILEALHRIVANDGLNELIRRFNSLPDALKDSFRDHVRLRLHLEMINSERDYAAKKDLLKSLPFFRTLDKSGFKKQHFVSLKKVSQAVLDSFSVPFELPSVVIHLQEPDSGFLQKHLNILVLSDVEVLCQIVFPRINKGISTDHELTVKAMKFALAHLEIFEHKHPGFKQSVSQTKFLSDGHSMMLKMPNQLFDDSFKDIRLLFFKCNAFPMGELSKDTYRSKLRMIGLKGLAEISVNDFFNSACDIDRDLNKQEAEKRARSLQALLNLSLKSGYLTEPARKRLKQSLKSLKWIPPCKKRPDDYPKTLAFVAENSALLSPKEVYLYSFNEIIGSVKATADLHDFRNLVEFFELAREPTVLEVVRHLDNIVSLHEPNSATVRKRKREDAAQAVEIDKQVTRVCEKVYAFLNSRVENNRQYLSSLTEKNYVLVNGQFVKASHCAFRSQLNCPPLLCCLPYSYKDLWKAMGVKEQFDIDSYLQIVEEIYQDVGEQQLSKGHLDIVLRILNECAFEEDQLNTTTSNRKFYLPDHQGVLRPALQLCFNDTPWLPVGTNEDTAMCHSRIAYEVAQRLGVASWRQKTVNSHRKQLPGQRFGQREKLVTRLKKILEGYPLDDGILKELVQNADDAGATKIHFIKDMRILPSQMIFDEKWKPIQGCSLCVYNDKPFTQADLQGIQDLGEGSKSNERTKIGQYGVGFNCIYHLTDVPTFLTNVINLGRVLCVMDPTLQHVDGASVDSPGFMYEQLDSLKKQFPHVFTGFLENHYDSMGTIFRFPLRRQESTISQNIVTEEKLSQLFKTMEEEMQSCLIFLRNIKEIALKEICPNGKLREIYCVRANLDKQDQNNLDDFQKKSKDVCALLEAGSSLDSVAADNVSYAMQIVDSRRNRQDWVIVQQLGFHDPSCVSKNLKAAHLTGQLNQMPLAGIAYKISDDAAPKVQQKLFCFLPLPKTTRLPVHVNGNFSLDNENRRTLWENDKGDIRTEWNKCLMMNVAAWAYCTLLSKVKDLTSQEIQDFERKPHKQKEGALMKYRLVFPEISAADGEYVRNLCLSVYQILWKENLTILPVHSAMLDGQNVSLEWMGPQGTDCDKPCFDLLEDKVRKVFPPKQGIYKFKGEEEQSHEVLRRVLICLGFSLVHFSCSLYCNFKQAGLEPDHSSPERVLQFFANFKQSTYLRKKLQLPCDLKDTPFENVQTFKTVLRFCSTAQGFKARISLAPFLLTQGGDLREFNVTSKPYFSSDFCLVPHGLHEFAHEEIAEILSRAGMTKAFDVVDLVRLLPGLLPSHIFCGDNKSVTLQTLVDYLCTSAKLNMPPYEWLKRIWKFLSQKIKVSDYQHLHGWCLLPVKSVVGDILLPISKASSVTSRSRIAALLDENLLEALFDIGMPFLNEDITLLQTLERLLNATVHLSAAVVQHFIQNRTNALNISEHRRSLLRYLYTSCNEWKNIHGAIDAIRCLSVFEYFDGSIGDLLKSKRYIVSAKVPKEEATKWTSKCDDAVFLKSDYELQSFLKLLGCTPINNDLLYSQLILKEFHVLPDNIRFQHLRFIKDNMIHHIINGSEEPENHDGLLKILQSLKFLHRPGSHDLVSAASLFDPEIEIFKIMQDPSDFPPELYTTDDWLKFLRVCGLVCEVTEGHLLKYAEDVSKSRNCEEFGEPVKKKARFLVESIGNLDNFSDEFAIKIRTMPIVPAVVVPEKLLKLHCQKMDKSGSFVVYKDSFGEEHKDLIWTTSDLLPHRAMPRKRKLCDKLNISAKPPGKIVAQHLANVCNSFLSTGLHTEEVKKEFCRVVTNIYRFLSAEEVAESEVSLLINSNCIILNGGTDLGRPDQVVIAMPEESEIRPYLYSLPSQLYQYMSFFEKLQMAKDVQPAHYAGVLSMIHKNVGRVALIPNDRRLVLMAMSGFLKQLNGKRDDANLKELILPSENGKLYRSSKLVIKDNLDFAQRISHFEKIVFMVDLDELKEYGLSNVTHTIFDNLPQNLRPSLLSSVVSQRLDAEPDFIKGLNIRSSRIQKTITSQQFEEGLLQLMQSRTSDTVNEDKIKNLSKLKVYELSRVTTYLEHKEERILGSEKQCSFFISHTTADVVEVYIDQSLQAGGKDTSMLSAKLADILNEVLGGVLQPILAFVAALLQCNPNDIQFTLDKFGFPIGGSSTTAPERRPFLPKLGSFVPIDMHYMLQQGFCSFSKGDIVALETGSLEEDSVYIMVEIVEEIAGNSESDSMLNARYRVNTGENEDLIVNGSDLYQFCSPLCKDDDGALVLVEKGSETDPEAGFSSKEEVPQFRDIIRDIKKKLIEAKTLPDAQKRRVIKRLYLKWHPDKNPPELAALCTRVVQTLQKLVERIDSLTTEDDDDEEEGKRTSQDFHDGQFSHRRGHFHNQSRPSGSSFRFNFTFCDDTARNHRENRENFHSQAGSSGGYFQQPRGASSFSEAFTRRPNPQPQEAKRWMRQAEYDFTSAEQDKEMLYFEWSCYKYHQAAEKSLKAVQFLRDANQHFTHSLASLCADLDDRLVVDWVRQLEALIPNPAAMRYPNCHNYPNIPHDTYDREITEKVGQLAANIVKFAKRQIS